MKLKNLLARETPNIPLTINNLLLVFKEFLSVWLNQILYYNKVYDPLVFDEYKAFDVIVWMNRHPHLEKYIDDLFLNIINSLIINKKQSNGLDKITCLVYNTRDDTVVRSYSIKFHQFILTLSETIAELKINDDHDTSSILSLPNTTWTEIYTQFQTTLFQHIQHLRKITISESQGEQIFFKITVGLLEEIYAGSNWVRLNESKQHNRVENIQVLSEADLGVLNFTIESTDNSA